MKQNTVSHTTANKGMILPVDIETKITYDLTFTLTDNFLLIEKSHSDVIGEQLLSMNKEQAKELRDFLTVYLGYEN